MMNQVYRIIDTVLKSRDKQLALELMEDYRQSTPYADSNMINCIATIPAEQADIVASLIYGNGGL